MKVACIGAGYFSQFHLAGWRGIAGVDLVGITDQDGDRAQASGVPVFDTLEQMLAETQPDILDVILPPPAQAAAIQTALRAPLRAIICQKPFCATRDEAVKITELAEHAGIPLIIHENFCFQPWYRVMKKAMEAGQIGEVRQATFRLRPGDGQGAQAYLARQPYFRQMPRFLIHETGVHFIDVFRYLLGDPVAVYADLRRENPVIAGEDAGYVLFDFAGGVRALFDGNRTLDHAAADTRCTMGEALVEGTQGTLSLCGDGSVMLRLFGETTGKMLSPPDLSGLFGGNCAGHLQAHVVLALAGERPLENQARDYLRVVEIEDAVYRSAELGTRIALG